MLTLWATSHHPESPWYAPLRWLGASALFIYILHNAIIHFWLEKVFPERPLGNLWRLILRPRHFLCWLPGASVNSPKLGQIGHSWSGSCWAVSSCRAYPVSIEAANQSAGRYFNDLVERK